MLDNTILPRLNLKNQLYELVSKIYQFISEKRATIFPHSLLSAQYIDSFGENGDSFFMFQNIYFSYLLGSLDRSFCNKAKRLTKQQRSNVIKASLHFFVLVCVYLRVYLTG